jgi:hypothetical protein
VGDGTPALVLFISGILIRRPFELRTLGETSTIQYE